MAAELRIGPVLLLEGKYFVSSWHLKDQVDRRQKTEEQKQLRRDQVLQLEHCYSYDPSQPTVPTQQAPALGEKSSHGQAAPGSEQGDRAVDIPAHCKDLD